MKWWIHFYAIRLKSKFVPNRQTVFPRSCCTPPESVSNSIRNRFKHSSKSIRNYFKIVPKSSTHPQNRDPWVLLDFLRQSSGLKKALGSIVEGFGCSCNHFSIKVRCVVNVFFDRLFHRLSIDSGHYVWICLSSREGIDARRPDS